MAAQAQAVDPVLRAVRGASGHNGRRGRRRRLVHGAGPGGRGTGLSLRPAVRRSGVSLGRLPAHLPRDGAGDSHRERGPEPAVSAQARRPAPIPAELDMGDEDPLLKRLRKGDHITVTAWRDYTTAVTRSARDPFTSSGR